MEKKKNRKVKPLLYLSPFFVFFFVPFAKERAYLCYIHGRKKKLFFCHWAECIHGPWVIWKLIKNGRWMGLKEIRRRKRDAWGWWHHRLNAGEEDLWVLWGKLSFQGKEGRLIGGEVLLGKWKPLYHLLFFIYLFFIIKLTYMAIGYRLG